MSSSYEFWLLDDTGRRITLLQKMSFFSYSRSVVGFGTIEVGIPYREYIQQVPVMFQPDWRIDVWRSPKIGVPKRREGMYLLRKPRIYTRETDAMQIIIFYGRDCKDLVNRRHVIQAAGTSYTRKSDAIDDMMKAIVREQMLYGSALDVDGVSDNSRAYPQDEFFVAGDLSLGPLYSKTFPERNVMDVLRELQDASRQLYEKNPLSNQKIYFDVVPVDLRSMIYYILDEETGDPILDESGEPLVDEQSVDTSADIGFRFVTYAGLYGQDRTDALVFSVENNNVKDIEYSENYLEEKNSAIVKGFGRGDSRDWVVVDNSSAIGTSRWNRIEVFVDASTEPDQDRLEDFGYPALDENSVKKMISCTFLNVGGSEDTPESLYGVQWDLGDLLPVYYVNRYFSVEVEIVHVAMDENGIETITGRSDISDAN